MKTRIYILDLLRWLLASYVIFFHFWAWTKSDNFWIRHTFAARIFSFGYLSVDVFFVISGIAISSAVIGKSPKGFFVSRLRRLIPPFVFVSILETLFVLFLRFRNDWGGSWLSIFGNSFSNLLPISGSDSNLRNFVAWSLGVEIQFYVIVLAVIYAAAKFHLDQNKITIILARSWICIIYLFGFMKLEITNSFALFEFAPYFIFGILFFSFVQNKNTVLLLDLITLLPLLSHTLQSRIASASMPGQAKVGLAVFIFFVGIILASVKIQSRFPKSLFSSSVVIGESSYTLYLLGGFLGIVTFTHLKTTIGIFNAGFISYLTCSLIALLYQLLFHKHCLSLIFKAINVNKENENSDL